MSKKNKEPQVLLSWSLKDFDSIVDKVRHFRGLAYQEDHYLDDDSILIDIMDNDKIIISGETTSHISEEYDI